MSLLLAPGDESHTKTTPSPQALLALAAAATPPAPAAAPAPVPLGPLLKALPGAWPSVLQEPTVVIDDMLQDPAAVRGLKAAQVRGCSEQLSGELVLILLGLDLCG